MTTAIDFVVLDSHALLWYLENSPRLSAAAKLQFNDIHMGASSAVIPTIVLAELMFVSEKGVTPLGFVEIVERIRNSRNFGVVSLHMGILNIMHNLANLEIHDRIIVATALSIGARLITRDRAVRDSGLVECIW